MRYMSIYKTVERGTPPTQEEMAGMGALIEEYMKKGSLIETGGLLPSKTGFRVRRSNGKITVTDGPFTETKEVVGGYAIMEAKSNEEMLKLTKHFLEVAGEGECEVRPMHEMGG
ncbi:MAG: YciI family protein [Gemmatimonadaceae bacterium]